MKSRCELTRDCCAETVAKMKMKKYKHIVQTVKRREGDYMWKHLKGRGNIRFKFHHHVKIM